MGWAFALHVAILSPVLHVEQAGVHLVGIPGVRGHRGIGGLLPSETAWAGAVGLGEWVCHVLCSSRGGCRLLCLLCCEGSKQVCIFLVYHVFHTGGLLLLDNSLI